MYTEKFRPKNPSMMVGNEESRIGFINWLRRWRKGAKPALLIGPPGIGKTTLVYAAAESLGYVVLEFNASDTRTKERLSSSLTPSTHSLSVLGEKLLVFLDEVDGLYARQDYGGLEFIQGFIEKSNLPVVLAANLEDDEKVRKLLPKCEVFAFKRVPPRLIHLYLKSLIEREQLNITIESINKIVEHSGGDIRAALNSLQAVLASPSSEVLEVARDKRVSLRDALNTLFNSSDREEAKSALEACDADILEKIHAIYSSLVQSKVESSVLLRSLLALSAADELVSRIKRTQEWRQLRYFNAMLSHMIFDATPRGVVQFSQDAYPWSIQLRIWNDARVLRSIGRKLGSMLHTSSREALIVHLPYLAYLLSRLGKDETQRILREFTADESELRVLNKEVARFSK
ncbi:MAG: AAA family ATPase [Nitrososphaerales archaeon]